MRTHPTWQRRLGANTEDAVFGYLMTNLTRGITTYQYFVNWVKVDVLTEAVKDEMHLLDGLLTAADHEAELKRLLEKYPSIAPALPALLAIRMKKKKTTLDILTKYAGGGLAYKEFDFSEAAAKSLRGREQLVEFARDSGILDLFKKPRVTKSVPDYLRGVEVGLDTNGRKNRGGRLMELVVEEMTQKLAGKHGWGWMNQPTEQKVQAAWGIEMKPKSGDWRPDVALLVEGRLWLIECNFYNSQGSKLKATAGEYVGSAAWCDKNGYGYIWITDGEGWRPAEAPLRDAFSKIGYTLSLKMCADGCLEDILAEP